MSVTLHLIVLEGFGRYRQRIEVPLYEGMNTLVAPNESGKSTLVFGLTAVLFGLPQTTTADAWGVKRFRNWDDPERFWGSVEFSSRQTRYRVTRQFETNRISLDRMTSSGKWETVVSGEHNPQAQKRNERYETELGDLLGVRSRELFLRTFCVSQPLSEISKIDSSVQELVLGAGGTYLGAVSWLQDKLRTLTRFNVEFGVGSRNANNDRQIELLKSEISLAEKSIREHSLILDSLYSQQAELVEIEQQRRSTEALLRQKQEALAGWSAWLSARQTYDTALRQRAQVEQAIARLKLLRQEEEAIKREITEKYSWFSSLPLDTREQLQVLSGLEQRQAEKQSELTQLRREREGLLTRHTEIRAKISGSGDLDSQRDWNSLGESPVQSVRYAQAQGQHFLRVWRGILDTESLAESLRQRISEQYSLFEGADARALYAMADYVSQKAMLEKDMAAKAAALASHERQVREVRELERELEAEFGDLMALDESAQHLALKKIELLQQKHRESAEALGQRGSSAATVWPLLVAAVCAVALFGATWFLMPDDTGILRLLLPTLASLLGAMASYGLLQQRGQSPVALAKISQIDKELQTLKQALGKHDSDDLAALSALSARLARRQSIMQQMLRQNELLQAQPDVDLLRRQLSEATLRLNSFRRRVQQFERAYANPGISYQKWRECQALLAETRASLAGQVLGVVRNADDAGVLFEAGSTTPGRLADISVTDLNESFLVLLSLARLFGEQPHTLGDLALWLSNLDSSWWASRIREASEFEQMGREALRLADAGEHSEKRVSSLETEIDGLSRQVEAQRQRFSDLLHAAGGVTEAIEMWDCFEKLSQKKESLAVQISAMLGGQGCSSEEGLALKLADLDTRVHRALGQWEDLCQKTPGLPPADLSIDFEAAGQRHRELSDEVARLSARLSEEDINVDNLRRQVAQSRGARLVNISHSEEEVVRLKQQLCELLADARSIALAHQELEAARREYQATYREQMALRATERFRQLAGVESRAVVLDEDFHVCVQGDSGPVAIQQLSQGAKDQLYFSLRLAVADLLAQDTRLPFILDDPFLTFDADRANRVRELLVSLARTRQIILLSHRPEIACWGRQVSPHGRATLA